LRLSRRATARWATVAGLTVCTVHLGRAVAAGIAWRARRSPGTLAARPPPPLPSAARPPPAPGAALIGARNVFDSATGPLGVASAAPSAAAVPVHPLAAPACEDLRVESTAVANNPRWSSAVLQSKDADHGRLARVGDVVGGREVLYIGYNRARHTPAVWLTAEGALCQVSVFGKPPPPVPKKAHRKGKASRARRGRGRR
jgi:hypothetical protein